MFCRKLSQWGNRSLGSPAGGRLPFILWCSLTDAQPRDRCPSHARPNSRMTSIAHTRQVTVTRIICGVDISSQSLSGAHRPRRSSGPFPNTAEGIAALAAFCQAHQVDLVAMEATGGYEQRPNLPRMGRSFFPAGTPEPRPRSCKLMRCTWLSFSVVIG
jgi:hypothetical protein